MSNEFKPTQASDDDRSQTELDLLEALLATDDTTYPWNPTDLESEEYFIEQERQFALEDWSESEITARSDAFFSKLEQIWSETVGFESTDIDNLQANLQQRAASIPQGWLQAIAHQAYHVLAEQKSMTDKLVQCVKDLLPNWAEDDLQVLARPFAYTMRSVDTIPNTPEIESVLGNTQRQEWAALSEIEQARASLAIARYALAQLQKEGLEVRE